MATETAASSLSSSLLAGPEAGRMLDLYRRWRAKESVPDAWGRLFRDLADDAVSLLDGYSNGHEAGGHEAGGMCQEPV